MPRLLRFVIALIGFVYLQAAIFIPVISIAASRRDGGDRPSALASAGLGAGVALLALGPMTAGLAVSTTRWSDADSLRRIRRGFAVLIASQVVGAVLAVAAGLADGVPVIVVIALVVIGFALTPALIALGRVARRRDVVVVTGDEWVDTTRALLRRGYRNAGIGAAIGLAVAVVLIAVLLVSATDSRGFSPQIVILGLAFGFMGAAIGMSLTSLKVARSIRAVTGGEFGTARRIARVVLRGKPETLSDEEQRSAARYATIVAQWLPFQTLQIGVLYAGLLLVQANSLASRVGVLDPVLIVVIVLLVGVLIVIVPLQLSRARRAGRYAVQHGGPHSVAAS